MRADHEDSKHCLAKHLLQTPDKRWVLLSSSRRKWCISASPDIRGTSSVPSCSHPKSHACRQDLSFHVREAGNAALSEALQHLHPDLELHLKPGPPSRYCTGGLQAFTPHFIWHIPKLILFSLVLFPILSFSLFNASVVAENQTTLTVLLSNDCFLQLSQLLETVHKPEHPLQSVSPPQLLAGESVSVCTAIQCHTTALRLLQWRP